MICGCLIIFRSVTYAQRAQRLLQRMGYTATVIRPGVEIIGDSCGFAVKVSERNLFNAVNILRNSGISPERTVSITPNGIIHEVAI